MNKKLSKLIMQKTVEKLSRAPKSYGMIPKKCNIYLESQKQMREKKEQKKSLKR